MKEKKKLSRNQTIGLEIGAAILLFAGLLLAKTFLHKNEPIKLTLEDQTINNVTFKNFQIEVEDDGVTRLNVDAYNNSNDTVKINNLVISLYDKNGGFIMNIQIPEEIVLENDGSYLISNQFNTDRVIASVEYSFN